MVPGTVPRTVPKVSVTVPEKFAEIIKKLMSAQHLFALAAAAYHFDRATGKTFTDKRRQPCLQARAAEVL